MRQDGVQNLVACRQNFPLKDWGRVARDSGVMWIAAHKPHSGRATIFGVLYSTNSKDFWISNSMLGRRLENHSAGADGIEHVSEISQVSNSRVCREDR